MSEYIEKKSLELSFYDTTIELIETEIGYEYSFQKSLSNINNISDILPLIIDSKFHVKCNYTENNDEVILSYEIKDSLSKFDNIENYKLHQKLRVLRNVGLIFDGIDSGYTYSINPKNLLIDDNNLVKAIYVGFSDTLTPLSQTNEEVIRQYKCLITCVLENHEFEYLLNGGLEIVKKTKFLDRVFNAGNIEEIIEMLEESFKKEEEIFKSDNVTVNKIKYSFYKRFSIISTIGFAICAIVAVYFSLLVIPGKNQLNDASTYFVSDDYGKVINTLRDEEVENLPVAQAYMLAYSYIQLEPLSDENKESALNSISVKSDRRYLNFWIYLGMEDYEKAISLSKELTDLQLQYHATYRAIDIIKKSTDIDGETKDQLLGQYNTSFESLEEQLFPEEELEVEDTDNE